MHDDTSNIIPGRRGTKRDLSLLNLVLVTNVLQPVPSFLVTSPGNPA
jgi:hypothetical protein